MSEFHQIDLRSIRDSRGLLTVVEEVLPFAIRRIFWVTGASGELRGGHRHHVTRQALVAIVGSIEVHLDDGVKRYTARLESPSRCLIVEPDDWHTMRFGNGAVLLVMASHTYDPSDYITTAYGPETHA